MASSIYSPIIHRPNMWHQSASCLKLNILLAFCAFKVNIKYCQSIVQPVLQDLGKKGGDEWMLNLLSQLLWKVQMKKLKTLTLVAIGKKFIFIKGHKKIITMQNTKFTKRTCKKFSFVCQTLRQDNKFCWAHKNNSYQQNAQLLQFICLLKGVEDVDDS